MGKFRPSEKPSFDKSKIIEAEVTQETEVKPQVINNIDEVFESKEFPIIRFIEGRDLDVVVIVLNKDEMQVPLPKGKVFRNDKNVKLNIKHMDGKDFVIL